MTINENNSFDNSIDDAAQSAGADENLTTNSPVRKRKRWFAPAITAAILVPALAIGGGVAAAAHKTIELDFDGDVSQITTWSGSVSGVLEQEGIELGEHVFDFFLRNKRQEWANYRSHVTPYELKTYLSL